MNNCKKNSCKPKILKQLADQLTVIAEPNRLKILCLLSLEEKCVCEITKELKLKQNLISHHLKVLRNNGLVKARKQGLSKYHSIKNNSIKTLITNLTDLLNA